MNRDHLLFAAVFLSSAGAILSFLLGIGTGLAEQQGAWAHFMFAAIYLAVAVLCEIARGRPGPDD